MSADEACWGPGGIQAEIPGGWAGRDAGRALTALYDEHYASLMRLAALLVQDAAAAEEIAQDSFVALHAAWPRPRDSAAALAYLRKSVVNRCRSALRHRTIPDPNAADPPPGHPAAIAALHALPVQQREVVVMRYYADLSEAQIAAAMGISKSAVRRHAAQAAASLRPALAADSGRG